MPSQPMSATHRLALVGAVANGAGPANESARLVLANMLMFARVHTTDDGEPAGVQYRGGVRRLALPFREVSSHVVPQEAIDFVDEMLRQLVDEGFVTLVAEAVPPTRRGRTGAAAHWRINL